MASRDLAGLVGAATLWLSVPPMIYLQVAATGRLDTARATVSDYVSLPGGAALLAIAVLCLAVACCALPLALVRGGLPRPAPVCAAFGTAAAGLLATVVWPTNAVGTAVGASAVVHRYAAGLFFVAVPIAGWLVRRRLPHNHQIGWFVLGSTIVGGAFLASHIPLLWPGFPGADLVSTMLPRGLLERGLLVTDVLLLGAIGRVRR